jgi:hypothetical protein
LRSGGRERGSLVQQCKRPEEWAGEPKISRRRGGSESRISRWIITRSWGLRIMESRVVEVDKKFYAELCEALLPDERFMQEYDASRYGLVLYIVAPNIVDHKKLIFVPKREF